MVDVDDAALHGNHERSGAVNVNIGGPALQELIEFMDEQMAGAADDMRQYNGD